MQVGKARVVKIVIMILCCSLMFTPLSVVALESGNEATETGTAFTLIRGEEFDLTEADIENIKELHKNKPSLLSLDEMELRPMEDTPDFDAGFEIIEEGIVDPDAEEDFDELDSGIESFSSRAALPDLRLYDIGTAVESPLPVNTYIPFTMKIANIGTAAVTNIPVSTYMDGQLLGTNTFKVTLNPNQYVVVQANVGATTSGTHTVKGKVNPTNSITESNYSNNESSASFQWTYWPDLAVQEIDCDLGYSFPTMEKATFTFTIANIGTATATKFPITLHLYGDFADGGLAYDGLVTKGEIDSLQPGKGVYYEVEAGSNKSIKELRMEFRVDSNNSTNDFHRANNSLEEFYNIHPNQARFGGSWDKEILTVGIRNDGYDYLWKTGSNLDDIENSFFEWNDLSNIEYDSPVLIAGDNTQNYDCSVIVSQLHPDHAAVTVYFKTVLGIEVPVSNLVGDSSKYTRTQIQFNSLINPASQDTDYYKWVTTHEAGHALGLAHPFDVETTGQGLCSDQSVMNYPKRGVHSYHVSYHDEYNLALIYD